MDLPLARCGPSPPYRLRKESRLARRCPSALPKPLSTEPHYVRATRAWLQFVGRTHWMRIHSCIAADLPPCAREPRLEAIEAPIRSRWSSDKPGAFHFQEKNDFVRDFFDFFFRFGYFVAAKTISFGSLPCRRQSST